MNFDLIIAQMSIQANLRPFAPHVELIPQRQLNWIGRSVAWIHAARHHNLIYKSTVVAGAILFSFFLLWSLVGIPLFILGFKEFILQTQRNTYDQKVSRLIKQTAEENRTLYLKGIRTLLLPNAHVELSIEKRNEMLRDLGLSEDTAKGKSDLEILRGAAHLHPNWLTHYSLTVKA